MSDAMQTYERFVSALREISALDSIRRLLSWDEETQMPPKGIELRARQSSLVARLSHEQLIAPRIGEMLAELEGSELVRDGGSDAAVNVRETRRGYDRARKLPASLVEEMSRTAVLAHMAWVDARKRSDFPTFEPWLKRTLELKRQEAACVGTGAEAYDALLDYYEPGETTEEVRRVFEALRGPLVELVGRIGESPRRAPVELLHRRYPRSGQEALAREAIERIGFDFDGGRLDVAVHPFCSGLGSGDCRLTTRYDEGFFSDGFFSALHEAGHGLYHQGLEAEHWGTPRGEPISLGIHESQSRMWENLVGRGRAFWRFLLPRAREVFPEALADVGEDEWHFAINDVRPSLIRVDADEATYNLHVLLRFELEQAMLSGDLGVAEVPGAWNERMQRYLGLTPPDDARGCLQDIHWSHGAIGYFPTYTLGNLYAAQLFEQARGELGGLDGQIARGEFESLLGWLREKIHGHGKRYGAREIVQRVTGRGLSAEPLLNHLKGKTEELYGL